MITATYLDDLSRVRISGTATGTLERSTDGRRWTVVRGGSFVAGDFFVDDYEFPAGVEVTYRVGSDTAKITVNLDTVWLKAIQHPFLNRPVTVTDWSSIGREFRGGVFNVVGRSFPVSVTDLRGARTYSLEIAAHTEQQARDIDFLLASGGPVFVHVPSGSRIPQIYAVIVGSDERRPSPRSERRIFTLELQEVAVPGVEVVGATTIWQSVAHQHASWADVVAGYGSWVELMDSTSDPSSVIVQ